MAHAYTPGLKVTSKSIVQKERRLPLKGEVVVKVGDEVAADKIIATTSLPGEVEPLNLAGKLGVPPSDILEYLSKKEGDSLEEGEIIAQTKGLLGLFKTVIKSPITGTLENISEITGQLILRAPPKKVEIDAYIDGKVVEVFKQEGVIIETVAAFVQGIFGIGGEAKGIITKIASSPDDIVSIDMIKPEHKGKILIGGSFVDSNTLKQAAKYGVSGVVVGGIDDQDLRNFLGYDIGVAITGSEDIGVTLVITEGFGKMSMAKRTFQLLIAQEGKKASINGATQIRAGVLRPEIVIPLPGEKAEEIEQESKGLEIGYPIRVIREPHFGAMGKVCELPPELRQIETEANVRTLGVELDDGSKIILPRANVEMIEE
ncbi:hypothetical protein KAX75_08860 [candidate division WOR-3 bacterium]|nr:hypothetical protein [candidate division WOR-3 bacterium]